MRSNLSAIVACFLALLMSADVARAVVLTNVGDSWQRESTGANHNSDLLSVWNIGGDNRTAVVQFDLSGIVSPISQAHLQLWSASFGFSDDNDPIKQTAFILDASILGNANGLRTA